MYGRTCLEQAHPPPSIHTIHAQRERGGGGGSKHVRTDLLGAGVGHGPAEAGEPEHVLDVGGHLDGREPAGRPRDGGEVRRAGTWTLASYRAFPRRATSRQVQSPRRLGLTG